ncbi:MAG: pyridoxamine 5'-phosphate oxidase [Pseudomonadota bacterium]
MSTNNIIPPTPDDNEYDHEPDRPLIRPEADPIELFRHWLADANGQEVNDANAMSLATVAEGGMPDVRIVLLKDVGPAGFSFYTHQTSAKGQQLISSGKAALCFHWKSLRRQVRVRGKVSRVPEGEADEYFASRARDSQLGAWASDQSQPISDRAALLSALKTITERFDGQPSVARPPHWGGFIVEPEEIEFWQDQPYRLHDRVLYKKTQTDWDWSRLNP